MIESMEPLSPVVDDGVLEERSRASRASRPRGEAPREARQEADAPAAAARCGMIEQAAATEPPPAADGHGDGGRLGGAAPARCPTADTPTTRPTPPRRDPAAPASRQRRARGAPRRRRAARGERDRGRRGPRRARRARAAPARSAGWARRRTEAKPGGASTARSARRPRSSGRLPMGAVQRLGAPPARRAHGDVAGRLRRATSGGELIDRYEGARATCEIPDFGAPGRAALADPGQGAHRGRGRGAARPLRRASARRRSTSPTPCSGAASTRGMVAVVRRVLFEDRAHWAEIDNDLAALAAPRSAWRGSAQITARATPTTRRRRSGWCARSPTRSRPTRRSRSGGASASAG